MIRINLLPFRAARKKENIRQELSCYFLGLVLLILVMTYLQVGSSGRLNHLKAEEQNVRKELAVYEKNNRIAARIKANLKEIRDRLDIIHDLEQKKRGRLGLLTDVALAVPEGRLWLQSLSEKEGLLTINGTAMDNDTVALFMTNLEKTPSITSVDLKNTQLQDFPEYNLKGSGFLLSCETILKEAPPASEKKPKDSKGQQ
ncbi:MAG: PilN domain-containing protein [Deltaproteobacteria bacterium]|nr:PilN domain-containing protein [Deltaproteobacteria bacterium]